VGHWVECGREGKKATADKGKYYSDLELSQPQKIVFYKNRTRRGIDGS
jgi:hypothetical protein